MTKKINPQTGPKTPSGKAASSKNAQKAAIFTKGYLPSEDIAAKQAQFEALAAQWGATDPTRLMFLRTIEQAHLGIERQMMAERAILEGAIQSTGMVQAFAMAAGLDLLLTVEMPTWYFEEDATVHKELAVEIYQAFKELKRLHLNYSNQLSSQIAKDYPMAYAYVMSDQPANACFFTVLSKRYGLSSPALNLDAACKEIQKKYQYYLIWGANPERYEKIISGLRHAKARELIDWDKSNRYAVSLQNRLFKGFQGLAMMDQHEQMRNAKPVLEDSKSEKPMPIEEVSES